MKIPAKLKNTFANIPLYRAACLCAGVRDVDYVIALMIQNVEDKKYSVDKAIHDYSHGAYDEKAVKKLIDTYGLGIYCIFKISGADIRSKVKEPHFNEICVLNDLNADYIKNYKRG